MEKYTYLAVNLGCIIIPFLFSFYKKRAFYKEWKYFFPANISVAVIFLIWDEIFTQHGIWGFNSDYLIGIYLFSLPLEEILFFVCIPYACTFTYFALVYLLNRSPFEKTQKYISIILCLSLFLISIFNIDKLYTSLTFSLTSLFLLLLIIRRINLSYIFSTYLAIIPFFIMSNGVLTGSLLENPIVWYNDDQNLGLRFITIPVEDFIYGLLLITSNILLYVFFKKKMKNLN